MPFFLHANDFARRLIFLNTNCWGFLVTGKNPIHFKAAKENY